VEKVFNNLEGIALKMIYSSLSQRVKYNFDKMIDELYNLAIKGNEADKLLASYLDKIRRSCRG